MLLVEQSDFAKGTSSRSTKLAHGGVRYLRQGNITLVRDALRERTLLRNNAPHLVHDMPFLIPCRSQWQRFFYSLGLKVYDFLATGKSFGRSHSVSSDRAASLVPVIKRAGLRGGVVYHDGQFDDARLLINMARTATDHGAALVNYAHVTGLINAQGKITGVEIIDVESQQTYTATARCVINAAGPFCDAIRRLDEPACEKMIAASQGIHLVLPRHFFPGDVAMIVPKTSDGRVIFIIPWFDQAIIGTTDTPISELSLEPVPQPEEINFLLDTAAEYLSTAVQLEDVLSIFTGIRPLVKNDKSTKTASLARDHVIKISHSGLITITGGKWTTVRRMSEDCVDRAIDAGQLSAGPCITASLRLHGYVEPTVGPQRNNDPRCVYGSDLALIQQIEAESPELAQPLHGSLSLRGSDVLWAVRSEMARTVDDVFARRTRSLIFNARAAVEAAPKVARLMASELGRSELWEQNEVTAFGNIARPYIPPSIES